MIQGWLSFCDCHCIGCSAVLDWDDNPLTFAVVSEKGMTRLPGHRRLDQSPVTWAGPPYRRHPWHLCTALTPPVAGLTECTALVTLTQNLCAHRKRLCALLWSCTFLALRQPSSTPVYRQDGPGLMATALVTFAQKNNELFFFFKG